MVATYHKFNQFVADTHNGVHDLSSNNLMVALTAAAHAPVASNTVLANLTQVDYTYCSSRVITTSSSSQTAGLYKLVLADLTLTANGGAVGPLQYVVIYNNSSTNKSLIGWYDYGAEITLADGETFLIDFSAINGVIQDS
jgi:hypothetical protein